MIVMLLRVETEKGIINGVVWVNEIMTIALPKKQCCTGLAELPSSTSSMAAC